MTGMHKDILLTTLHLCSFGSFVWLVGLYLSDSISLTLALVSSLIFVLDGSVAKWLRNLPDDIEVVKARRLFCRIGQVCMMICVVLCLPFYTSVPWVRAGFLTITSPVVAIGFSQDAREACCLLFVMLVMVASCESEPAFVLCLLVEDAWLVFSTWKGAQLIESTEREAASFRGYYEHAKKILTVLLDCTLVVERASTGGDPVKPGSQLATIGDPDLPAWRVREDDPLVDHFFGLPMQSRDVLATLRSEEDRRRVREALNEVAQEDQAVPRLINNVRVRCSAVADAAAAATQIVTDAAGTGEGELQEEHYIEAAADLIIIGLGPRARRGNWVPLGACIGVRVVVGQAMCDQLPIIACDAQQSETPAPQLEAGDQNWNSCSSIAPPLFPPARSISMVVQLESERLSIEQMTLHFSRLERPQLMDWLCEDDVTHTNMWIQQNMNTMWNDTSAESTGLGPIRLSCGGGEFMVASDAVVDAKSMGRMGRQQSVTDSSVEQDECAEGAQEGLAPLTCCVRFLGVSQYFWSSWVAAPGAHGRVPRPGSRSRSRRRDAQMPFIAE